MDDTGKLLAVAEVSDDILKNYTNKQVKAREGRGPAALAASLTFCDN